jgi:hypothetical protein
MPESSHRDVKVQNFPVLLNNDEIRKLPSMAQDTGITHKDVGNADIAGANICPCRYDASGILVYNDESRSLGTSNYK